MLVGGVRLGCCSRRVRVCVGVGGVVLCWCVCVCVTCLSLFKRVGLVGAHGAALVWNLFLPPMAPVLEMLNLANANAYYSNQCAWTRRYFYRNV